MQLSILIVNWNSKEHLRKCIAAIHSDADGVECEIVVVDSASFDGCGEMLRTEFPAVRFIQSPVNLGFAQSNNLAFEASRGKTVLFLNPDTEVTCEAIHRLYTAVNTLPNAGAVGGKLINSDGSLQTSCIQAFPTLLNQTLSAEPLRRLIPRSRLWGTRALFEPTKAPQKVEVISGACLMMRRAVFETIGRFSTEYFMYADDVDLCYKARQRGFFNYYVSDAVIIHHGGGCSSHTSSNFSSVMLVQSVSQFLRKSRGQRYSNCYRAAQSVAALGRLAVLLLVAPAFVAVRGAQPWWLVCSKWIAILNWGLGLSRLPAPCRAAESADGQPAPH